VTVKGQTIQPGVTELLAASRIQELLTGGATKTDSDENFHAQTKNKLIIIWTLIQDNWDEMTLQEINQSFAETFYQPATLQFNTVQLIIFTSPDELPCYLWPTPKCSTIYRIITDSCVISTSSFLKHTYTVSTHYAAVQWRHFLFSAYVSNPHKTACRLLTQHISIF